MATKTASTSCWLLKSEPGTYSIDDLARDRRSAWDGVRNYQARNFIRDGMKVGDPVLFYHSSADPTGIAGVARVCRAAYPDATALDPKHHHHDPKSTKDEPIWFVVDIEFVEKFPHVVSLEQLKGAKELDGMLVLRRGQRLSVQPVEKKHFDAVVKMGAGSDVIREGGIREDASGGAVSVQSAAPIKTENVRYE